LDRSDGLMKLRTPSKHRRNQDQHQFNLMQYAEHERAPIPVPRVRILSRNINSIDREFVTSAKKIREF